MFTRVTKQVNGLENNLREGSLKKQDHLKLSMWWQGLRTSFWKNIRRCNDDHLLPTWKMRYKAEI